jgi:stringent starvation protein B
MTKPAHPQTQGTSTRPYLIRALHDWCTDNGYTPYVAVFVDPLVQVPMEYVKNNEIVLNVGFEATSGLKLGNETIEFKARFGGLPREIVVPVDHVVAIYARENGQGMAFPVPTESGIDAGAADGTSETGGRGLRLASTEDSAQDVSNATVPPDKERWPRRPTNKPSDSPPASPQGPGKPGGRPTLKRVK